MKLKMKGLQNPDAKPARLTLRKGLKSIKKTCSNIFWRSLLVSSLLISACSPSPQKIMENATGSEVEKLSVMPRSEIERSVENKFDYFVVNFEAKEEVPRKILSNFERTESLLEKDSPGQPVLDFARDSAILAWRYAVILETVNKLNPEFTISDFDNTISRSDFSALLNVDSCNKRPDIGSCLNTSWIRALSASNREIEKLSDASIRFPIVDPFSEYDFALSIASVRNLNKRISDSVKSLSENREFIIRMLADQYVREFGFFEGWLDNNPIEFYASKGFRNLFEPDDYLCFLRFYESMLRYIPPYVPGSDRLLVDAIVSSENVYNIDGNANRIGSKEGYGGLYYDTYDGYSVVVLKTAPASISPYTYCAVNRDKIPFVYEIYEHEFGHAFNANVGGFEPFEDISWDNGRLKPSARKADFVNSKNAMSKPAEDVADSFARVFTRILIDEGKPLHDKFSYYPDAKTPVIRRKIDFMTNYIVNRVWEGNIPQEFVQ